MHSQELARTNNNQHLLLCQSCLWKIAYFDQSGKIGSIPYEKHVRCPICTTGIILEK
jgi:hypothetical protein